jgi:single-stranded-DNA-specific exonuclease
VRWHVKTRPNTTDGAIATACGISPVSAAILRERGYTTQEEICSFFNPSPSLLRVPLLLPDIEAAIQRLHQAITSQEPLLVYGDYDVDGVTSTALLVRSLRALGANVEYEVPERADGYGLSVGVVEEAGTRGIRLIVTADCGITAHEPVQKAKELGIDVIITDHHEPLPDEPLRMLLPSSIPSAMIPVMVSVSCAAVPSPSM